MRFKQNSLNFEPSTTSIHTIHRRQVDCCWYFSYWKYGSLLWPFQYLSYQKHMRREKYMYTTKSCLSTTLMKFRFFNSKTVLSCQFLDTNSFYNWRLENPPNSKESFFLFCAIKSYSRWENCFLAAVKYNSWHVKWYRGLNFAVPCLI